MEKGEPEQMGWGRPGTWDQGTREVGMRSRAGPGTWGRGTRLDQESVGRETGLNKGCVEEEQG